MRDAGCVMDRIIEPSLSRRAGCPVPASLSSQARLLFARARKGAARHTPPQPDPDKENHVQRPQPGEAGTPRPTSEWWVRFTAALAAAETGPEVGCHSAEHGMPTRSD